MNCARGADTRCTGAKGTCIRDTCAGGAYTKGICARVDFKGASTRAAIICIESLCVCSAGAVEHSEMHIQFFQILKIWDVRLEFQVEVNWTYWGLRIGCYLFVNWCLYVGCYYSYSCV